MTRRFLAIATLSVIIPSGCAPALPRWRQDARIVLDAVRLDGADKALPAEYGSALDTFNGGEALLREGDVENAESYYRFALLKTQLLEEGFAADTVRRAEEAWRRVQEEKLARERERALQDEQLHAAREKAASSEAKPRVEKVKPQPKERPMSGSHTVKRGETLPQIAALSDVYGDYRLWPLLYRANRDQISDPRHIWPGQILRIPRSYSRDDVAEARRYALEKPI